MVCFNLITIKDHGEKNGSGHTKYRSETGGRTHRNTHTYMLQTTCIHTYRKRAAGKKNEGDQHIVGNHPAGLRGAEQATGRMKRTYLHIHTHVSMHACLQGPFVVADTR